MIPPPSWSSTSRRTGAEKGGDYCRTGVQEDFPRGIDFPGVADDDTPWLWREALLDAGGAEFFTGEAHRHGVGCHSAASGEDGVVL